MPRNFFVGVIRVEPDLVVSLGKVPTASRGKNLRALLELLPAFIDNASDSSFYVQPLFANSLDSIFSTPSFLKLALSSIRFADALSNRLIGTDIDSPDTLSTTTGDNFKFQFKIKMLAKSIEGTKEATLKAEISLTVPSITGAMARPVDDAPVGVDVASGTVEAAVDDVENATESGAVDKATTTVVVTSEIKTVENSEETNVAVADTSPSAVTASRTSSELPSETGTRRRESQRRAS